jgi:predicted AAA+ superfamily ATPase
MQISRYNERKILNKLKPKKVCVLLGPRRVGKTELIKKIASQSKEPVLFFNGDDIRTHLLLEERSVANYRQVLGDHKLLIIDEAQEIENIGKKLKLIVDEIDDVKVLITGSSAFEINNQVGEPLVGRKHVFHMYPLAQLEYASVENSIQTAENLEERLIYGSYPELLHIKDFKQKQNYLNELVFSYLIKDVLSFEGIKKRDKIMKLLQMMAFRVGSEISVEGIGNELGISKNTVDKYLDLFEKVFIMYPVSGYTKNADNEITKKRKWYFWDNGVRNALINQFNSLSFRTDVGQLWENYLFIERTKKLANEDRTVFSHFWRTQTKQEIDRIEDENGQLRAYELKWSQEKAKIPPQFAKNYPDAEFTVVNKSNYLGFIL